MPWLQPKNTKNKAVVASPPALVVSHYINDIRVDRTGGKVTIETEIKLTEKTGAEFDRKCLELTSG